MLTLKSILKVARLLGQTGGRGGHSDADSYQDVIRGNSSGRGNFPQNPVRLAYVVKGRDLTIRNVMGRGYVRRGYRGK